MIDRGPEERIDTPSHLEWIWRLPVDQNIVLLDRAKRITQLDFNGKWASAMLMRRAAAADVRDPEPHGA